MDEPHGLIRVGQQKSSDRKLNFLGSGQDAKYAAPLIAPDARGNQI
jgi:hypothetical protein